MRSPSQLWSAVGRRLRAGIKWAVAIMGGSGREVPDLLFIVGCQRSGTTMMQDIFDRDLRCRVFRDVSALSRRGGPEEIRLDPLDDVSAVLRSTSAGFAVAKPLADSHRVVELLDRFGDARALWMYRDFRDVAASDLRYFGQRNGIRNLEPMLHRDPDNWRSAGLSQPVADLIRRWYGPDMNPRDAAALFWYARNTLFFEQALDRHPRVRLLRYERLVAAPHDGIIDLYAWLERPLPPGQLVGHVHAGSVGKGASVELSDDVERSCEELMKRLDTHLAAQHSSNPPPPLARPGAK